MLHSQAAKGAASQLPTPPEVSKGLPWLGHTLEFYRDQEGLFRRAHRQYGDVFTIRLMGQPMAILVGAEQHSFFFKQTDHLLDMEKPYEFLAAMFGKIAFLGPHEQYLRHRPVLHSLFGREQMAAYLGIISKVVQGWIDSLPQNKEIDISAEMVKVVKEVAGRCFLGDAVHERLEAVGFWQQYDLLSASLDPLMYKWPLPKFKRRDQAKLRIRQILQPLIDERRQQPLEDGFQRLLDQPDSEGNPLPDEVVASFFSALMFAGHETTAGQAAWTLIHLAHHGEARGKVIAEVERVMGEIRVVDHVQLRELKYTSAAVQESGRLRPSAETLFRDVKQDVEVKNFHIPKGWFVMTTTAAAHFMPQAYAEPYEYKPNRFLDGGEGKGFDYIAFGGGLHKCTGMNFASAEMAIIAALLFSQCDVKLVTPLDEIKVQRTGSSRPGKAMVKVNKKN